MGILSTTGNVLKTAFLPSFKSCVSPAERTHSFASRIFSLFSRRQHRVETFDDAVERLGLTDEKLSRRRSELLLELRLCYLAFAFSVFMFLRASISADLYAAAGSFFCMLFPATLMIIRAFRIDQIDRRELYAFPRFFTRPEAWFK